MRTEEDEPIYTYNDKYMWWFVRQSIKGGRVFASNQYYKSKICVDIQKIISEELNVNGKIYDIIEAHLNYKNKHFKNFEKQYENQFDENRDKNVEEKENYIIENLSQLPIHQLLKLLKLDELLWDFDAVSLYPSAMLDYKSIYLRIDTGYAYTEDIHDGLVKKVNTDNFTKGNALL